MNRTGLFIALGLWLVIGIAVRPLSRARSEARGVVLRSRDENVSAQARSRSRPSRATRRCGSPGHCAACDRRVVVKMIRPDRPLLVSGRLRSFLLVTMILSAGVLTNLTFKSYWGRPRPVVVTQFGGDQQFVPWWDPRGDCARNCSFFSGEGATAFWTSRRRRWRRRPGGRSPMRRNAVRRHHQRPAHGLRRALLHRCRDRRPRHVLRDLVRLRADLPLAATRLSDEAVDAALTRLTWPGYRLRQRLFGRKTGPARRCERLNACPWPRNLIFAGPKPRAAFSPDRLEAP